MKHLEQFQLESRKTSRSQILIASFRQGFANGWAFAVREAFKDALDIKLTDKTDNKKTRQEWTQGDGFAFVAGDVLYNDRSAYDSFAEFLKGPNPVGIQVAQGSPAGFVESKIYEIGGDELVFDVAHVGKNKVEKIVTTAFKLLERSYSPGSITFSVLRPNASRTALQIVEHITTSQSDFVVLLQSGKLYSNERECYRTFFYSESGGNVQGELALS